MPATPSPSPTPLAFGWELNRLQGATPDEIDRHLASLFASGTITRDEYLSRVRDLALAEAQAAPPEAAE